jgi:hypothetical protein
MPTLFRLYSVSILLLSLNPWQINAQWSSLTLSEFKFYTQAVAVPGKALIIGGVKPGFAASNKIEIYDFASQEWMVRSMQNARILSGIVISDSLIFIAGGLNPQTGTNYSTVEIYDFKNDVWKPTQQLSVARASIAAVKSGSELWFAGGYIQTSATAFEFYDVIDVYDLQTGLWSTRTLSLPRFCSGAVLGDKVVFAGGQGSNGALSIVDIFDTSTQQWSSTQLSIPRFNTAITTVGDYILIAGGSTYTDDALDAVDLFNVVENTWTTATLSAPRALIGAGTVCTQAIFAGGGNADWDTKFLTTSSNQVDFFDANTGQWSQGTLTQARTAAFAAGQGSHFFLGGGWYPEANQMLNSVEVYTCNSSGLHESSYDTFSFSTSPNPSSGMLSLDFGLKIPMKVTLYDLMGTQVASWTPYDVRIQSDLSQLPAGVYLIRAFYGGDKMLVDRRWVKW